MRVAICDDNIEILNFLEKEITAQFGNRFGIIRYEDAGNLLEDWRNVPKNRTDIVIMDIKFQGWNGVDVAKQLQVFYGTHIKVIFITGYPELVSEIFRAEPTFLLMKPIIRELLWEALEKAEALINEENDKAIYISFRGCLKSIKVKEIYYVESKGKKIYVNYIGGKEEVVQTLDEVQKQLPDYFLRIHKSYLINMNYVESYSTAEVRMFNGEEISVSRSRQKIAKEKFFEFLSRNT